MKNKIKSKDFIHNSNSKISTNIREIIFGMEDGIVSTLGALTGIAIATGNQFTIIISGLVIISVESISMGVGSYISSKSVDDIEDRKLFEESIQLRNSPKKEKEELYAIFCKDGWPSDLAKKMVEAASKNKKLMLKEMAYRELMLIPKKFRQNVNSGIFMFFSYIIGGIIPLFSYFFLPINKAVILSIIFSALGLFLLGSFTSKFTQIEWWKIGLRILSLGAISTTVGFVIGQLANIIK